MEEKRPDHEIHSQPVSKFETMIQQLELLESDFIAPQEADVVSRSLNRVTEIQYRIANISDLDAALRKPLNAQQLRSTKPESLQSLEDISQKISTHLTIPNDERKLGILSKKLQRALEPMEFSAFHTLSTNPANEKYTSSQMLRLYIFYKAINLMVGREKATAARNRKIKTMIGNLLPETFEDLIDSRGLLISSYIAKRSVDGTMHLSLPIRSASYMPKRGSHENSKSVEWSKKVSINQHFILSSDVKYIDSFREDALFLLRDVPEHKEEPLSYKEIFSLSNEALTQRLSTIFDEKNTTLPHNVKQMYISLFLLQTSDKRNPNDTPSDEYQRFLERISDFQDFLLASAIFYNNDESVQEKNLSSLQKMWKERITDSSRDAILALAKTYRSDFLSSILTEIIISRNADPKEHLEDIYNPIRVGFKTDEAIMRDLPKDVIEALKYVGLRIHVLPQIQRNVLDILSGPRFYETCNQKLSFYDKQNESSYEKLIPTREKIESFRYQFRPGAFITIASDQDIFQYAIDTTMEKLKENTTNLPLSREKTSFTHEINLQSEKRRTDIFQATLANKITFYFYGDPTNWGAMAVIDVGENHVPLCVPYTSQNGVHDTFLFPEFVDPQNISPEQKRVMDELNGINLYAKLLTVNVLHSLLTHVEEYEEEKTSQAKDLVEGISITLPLEDISASVPEGKEEEEKTIQKTQFNRKLPRKYRSTGTSLLIEEERIASLTPKEKRKKGEPYPIFSHRVQLPGADAYNRALQEYRKLVSEKNETDWDWMDILTVNNVVDAWDQMRHATQTKVDEAGSIKLRKSEVEEWIVQESQKKILPPGSSATFSEDCKVVQFPIDTWQGTYIVNAGEITEEIKKQIVYSARGDKPLAAAVELLSLYLK